MKPIFNFLYGMSSILIIRHLIFLLSVVTMLFTIVKCKSYSQELFKNNGQNLTSLGSFDVCLADIDGDSDLDAYVGKTVWLNNGAGQFKDTSKTFGTQNAYFADINGDGKADILCNDSILLNKGNYKYNFFTSIPSDMEMLYVYPVDIDNDKDVDVIVANDFTDSVFINDGTGKFINVHRGLGGWEQCRYAAGDINGDGFVDIVVGIPHTPPPAMKPSANKIWIANANGDYKLRELDISPEVQTRAIVLADLDNDSDLDLFVAGGEPRYGEPYSSVLINDGNGNFTLSQKINKGFKASDAAIADLDSDGDPDIFIANGTPLDNGQPNTVWLNDGTGNFNDSNLRLGNYNSIKVALGDLNGDSKTDAVVVNVKLDNNYEFEPAPLEIYLNE